PAVAPDVTARDRDFGLLHQARGIVAEPGTHATRHPDRDGPERALEARAIELGVRRLQARDQRRVLGMRGRPSARARWIERRARHVERAEHAPRLAPHGAAA